MPVSTLRAWVIGIILATIFAGVNQFFVFRYPSISFTNIVPQLLSYPIGCAAAAYIPRNWTLFGLELNPGPFSIKEHVLITVSRLISGQITPTHHLSRSWSVSFVLYLLKWSSYLHSNQASVASSSAYATDIIAVQRVFYNQVYNFSCKSHKVLFGNSCLSFFPLPADQRFLVLSTQLIGFSIGGIARHILVEPPSMIWPAKLVSCALFNTLHSEHYTGIGIHGGISRNRFFWYAFVLSFAWCEYILFPTSSRS